MPEILEQDTSSVVSNQKPTDTLISDSSIAIADIMSCEAIEWKNSNANRFLGTNAEALILSHNVDGTWRSLLWKEGLRFPENIIIRGRNISVNYFVDGSIRLEIVDAINKILTDDGSWRNSTRLEKSILTLTLDGKIYTNPIIILDGNWGIQMISKEQ